MSNIIKIDSDNPDLSLIDEACKILSNGDLVIIPTETVYGIACDPENSHAIKKLQEMKGRDKNKPISYLAGSIDQVKNVCINWNNGIDSLCKKYWPGPLTLVLETKKDWLGFRVSNHNVPILVCNTYGNFLALTSANISGKPDSSTAKAASILNANLILDGGLSSKKALPSSVIKIDGNEIEVIREGYIPSNKLIKCFKKGMNL